jgi:uncharacterized protein (DUF2336 family)
MGPSQMLIRDLHDRIGEIAPDRQALTLRHLTDLYLVGAEKFSSDEIVLIDDIFVRLVESIDDAARALLASRLGAAAKAPPRVLHRLACDDMIDVAAAVLKQSEALDDATLIECAVTKTQDHMLAISQRKTLSESVTDVLVKRGDRDVVLSTAMNAGARFSKNSFAILVKRAQGDDALTGCVGRRPDLPQALFEKLLEAASDAVRAALEAERPHLAREIDRAVNDVTAHIRSEATILTQRQATARVRVHSLNRAGKLNRAKLEEFARTGHAEELAAALALMAHVSDEAVTHIINDPDREALLALAKTIRLPWETTRIILAPRDGAGPAEKSRLKEYQAAFEQLQQPAARAIVDARCAHLQGETAH